MKDNCMIGNDINFYLIFFILECVFNWEREIKVENVDNEVWIKEGVLYVVSYEFRRMIFKNFCILDGEKKEDLRLYIKREKIFNCFFYYVYFVV